MFDCLKNAVAARPDLQRIGRYMHARFLLEVGDTPYHVTVESGQHTGERAHERHRNLHRQLAADHAAVRVCARRGSDSGGLRRVGGRVRVGRGGTVALARR